MRAGGKEEVGQQGELGAGSNDYGSIYVRQRWSKIENATIRNKNKKS